MACQRNSMNAAEPMITMMTVRMEVKTAAAVTVAAVTAAAAATVAAVTAVTVSTFGFGRINDIIIIAHT